MTKLIELPLPESLYQEILQYATIRSISLDEAITRCIVYGLAAINVDLVHEEKSDDRHHHVD